MMMLSDFDYTLPEEAIAQEPVEPRDASRLLVMHRSTGTLEHRVFREIIDYLRPEDTLVVNDTRVIPARVHAVKETGGKVELLLLSRKGEGVWEALVKPGRRVPPGTRLLAAGGAIQVDVLERTPSGGRLVRVSGAGDPERALLETGQVPLPPYIHRELADGERYQTVYAARSGSAAAPTAGLHFTKELLEQIRALGVSVVRVTLHVGLATFQPVRVEEITQHKMHVEQYEVSPEAAEQINATRGRVIAVGTTSTRVLESSADEAGRVRAGAGTTQLYIYPGYRFRVVDAMVTNFHVPRSTLLIMVSAFAGREAVLHAYAEALQRGYRFFSFGDAMLIL